MPRKALFELGTVIKFLMVGGFTAVFYFSMFTIFWKLMHLNYKIAVSTAFVIATSTQFFLNRHLTFRCYNSKRIEQIVKYITMVVVNYLITFFVVKSVVELLLWSPYIGIIISIGITVITGYLMSKFWVFKQNTTTLEET